MSEFLHDDHAVQTRIDLGLWRRVVAHAGPFRASVLWLALTGIAIAAMEIAFPLLTGLLIDEAIDGQLDEIAAALGALYMAVVVGFCVAVWLFIVLAGRVATGVAFELRRKGFDRLQQLSFSWFDVRPVGWLVTRLTSDVSKVSNLLPWFTLDLAWGLSTIAGITITMFILDWRLALVVCAIVPPLVLISVFFQRRLLESSRQIRKTNSEITAAFNECINGVRTTKTLVREEANLREFEGLTDTMYGSSMRNALQSAVYLPLVIMIGFTGVGLALWQGGVRLDPDGGLTYGRLIIFMQFAALFSMPIQELARRFTEVQSAQAAAERIQGLIDTEPKIADSDAVLARIAEHAAGTADDVAFDGGPTTIERIEFRDIDFQYKEDEPVLVDFNLTVERGQTVALVGETGGGKSTIVQLLARFYEPTSGEVRINGTDYRERSLHWLQSNFGVVLQSPFLFKGSVRENIRYGRLEATDAEVEDAARTTNADAFISELEDGYDFDVGEGGRRLSTGQRQLIALARAVLADPQIFIMDEATSSVDTETEQLIQNGIDAVLEGRIAFVIAHRLSTIRAADIILVIRNGRIVEQGSHQELLSADGAYAELYERQFAREQEAALTGGALS